jgi:site-specific recombinase XerD
VLTSLPSSHNNNSPDQDLGKILPVNEASVWLANFTSKATRRSYAVAVSQFANFHGAANVEDLARLDRAHVIAWREALIQSGASPRTVANRLAALSSLYDHLCETQHAAVNPTEGVKRPKVRAGRVEAAALSAAEVRRLLQMPDTQTLKGLRDTALLHVFFYTGCRVSEPCSLRIRHYSWDQGYRVLNFIIKGGKANRVAIHPNCTAALDVYLAAAGHGGDPDAWLFRQVKHKVKRARAPMHRATFDQVFRKYAALATLPPGTTPHAARATFITEALEKEHPAEAVQNTVGHAHISTTLAYDKRENHPRKSASFVVGY